MTDGKGICVHNQPWVIGVSNPKDFLDRIPICLALSVMNPWSLHLALRSLPWYYPSFPWLKIRIMRYVDCMSQNAINKTLQYLLSYTWHARVVKSFNRLTWQKIIHEFFMSPLTYIRFTWSTSFLGRSNDVLKTNTLYLYKLQ